MPNEILGQDGRYSVEFVVAWGTQARASLGEDQPYEVWVDSFCAYCAASV